MNAEQKFGHRLRAIRKSRKLNIGQLAEKADTDVKHLGRVERGEKRPSFDLIVALAHALNVSPAKLFEFDAPQNDADVLRKQLERLLVDVELAQLQKVHRILEVLLEP